VGVAEGVTGVYVAVGGGGSVLVRVGVTVRVGVLVAVGVMVGVRVTVGVDVRVGVRVGVLVYVAVGKVRGAAPRLRLQDGSLKLIVKPKLPGDRLRGGLFRAPSKPPSKSIKIVFDPLTARLNPTPVVEV
jgi:hypothetical protein